MQRRLHPSLPLFAVGAGPRRVLYTPGSLAIASTAAVARLEDAWSREAVPADPAEETLATRMEECARRAEQSWRALVDAPFEPECLTIYMSNRCNLACTYCYAAESNRNERAPRVSLPAVRAAAAHVAASCASKGKPLQVVVHGGGEPTMEWPLLEQVVVATRQAAREAGVEWTGYLATNGVVPDARMRTVIGWFDAIGLSCDGPPDIHDRQRPRLGGGASSRWVVRMAGAVAEGGKRLTVRATITPSSMYRQAEIAAYLGDTLGAHEIRFEPVYTVRGESTAFTREGDAERFADHFLEAQRVTRERNGSLTLAGIRLDEIHGPHCSALKSALHLIPGDLIAGCFFLADATMAGLTPSLVVGRVEGERLVLDAERVAAHRACAGRVPDACRNCVAIHHCARECPEVCMACGDMPAVGGFRCRLHRRLAETWITELAAPLLAAGGVHDSAAEEAMARVRAQLAHPPDGVDTDEILLQAEAMGARLLAERPAPPGPIWRRRGFEERGATACARLADLVRASGSGPWSVYVHVPFCDRRCTFCDCYSLALGRRGRERQEAYVHALLAELATWSRWGPLECRPVTTVHFGGGTANLLDEDLFERLLDTLRDRLGVSARTEWAVESTSSLLSRTHLERLWSWGFRRLHVGVQTLEHDVRPRIGRRETADAVVDKLEGALQRGFVVSVDLIYGLPGQTLAGHLATIDRLVRSGVHGFSLYELQRSARNERFLARQRDLPRDPVERWLLLQAGEQRLRRHGYRKTHFTHYARPADENLYYAHTVRGEDLLALGASADGVVGSYHYRHEMHDAYVAGQTLDDIALEGGMEESPLERGVASIENALMSARIPEPALAATPLLQSWLTRALLAESAEAGMLSLTANGSYLIAEMIGELNAQRPPMASRSRDGSAPHFEG